MQDPPAHPALPPPRDQSAPSIAAPLHRWVIDHDDRWSFILLYVGLAVVLSIVISLFWLVVVVAAHFVLELVRQRHVEGWSGRMVGRALWEIKLDVALVLFAMALALYMELVLGAAGLGSAARMGTQAAARAAGWTRAIRGVMLSVDDAAQVGRAVLSKRRGDEPPATDDEREERRRGWRGWLGGWGVGDHIAIWLGLACLALIALAPTITHHTWPSTFATLIEELQPFPGPLADEFEDTAAADP